MILKSNLVSGEGVEILNSRVDAILKIAPPKNLKELQRFLGMINYYRRFIKNFAARTYNMRKMLKKGAWKENRWGEEEQKEFEEMKKVLTEAPIMAYPDFSLPFILETDASAKGIGAVLLQIQNGQEKVIAYASKALSEREQRLTSTEMELLDKPFIIRSDHSALQHHSTIKAHNPKLIRWIFKLTPFKYTIEYKEGSSNIVPDALSRLHNIFEKTWDYVENMQEDPRFGSIFKTLLAKKEDLLKENELQDKREEVTVSKQINGFIYTLAEDNRQLIGEGPLLPFDMRRITLESPEV